MQCHDDFCYIEISKINISFALQKLTRENRDCRTPKNRVNVKR